MEENQLDLFIYTSSCLALQPWIFLTCVTAVTAQTQGVEWIWIYISQNPAHPGNPELRASRETEKEHRIKTFSTDHQTHSLNKMSYYFTHKLYTILSQEILKACRHYNDTHHLRAKAFKYSGLPGKCTQDSRALTRWQSPSLVPTLHRHRCLCPASFWSSCNSTTIPLGNCPFSSMWF